MGELGLGCDGVLRVRRNRNRGYMNRYRIKVDIVVIEEESCCTVSFKLTKAEMIDRERKHPRGSVGKSVVMIA